MKSRVVQLRASPATYQGLIDAEREFGHGEPDLILAFLPPDGNLDDTLAAMAQVWPASRRAGVETTHQISGPQVSATGCLQLFQLDGEDHRISIEVFEGDRQEPFDEAAIEKVRAALAAADSALLLADGLRFPIRRLLAELSTGEGLPTIAGALASRREPFEEGGPGARVFLDTTVYESACLVLGFEGVEMDVAAVSDFRPASPIYSVTGAEDRVIHEIDGEPAVDWYRRFFLVDGKLAPLPETARSFPLMIEGPEPARHGLCRAMRAFDDPPGAVTYWGDVRDGDQVRLGIAAESTLVRVAEELKKKRAPEAALLYTFMEREKPLEEGFDHRLADLHLALGDIALGGCVTFGATAPGEGGEAVLHNQTALLVLLAEKE